MALGYASWLSMLLPLQEPNTLVLALNMLLKDVPMAVLGTWQHSQTGGFKFQLLYQSDRLGRVILSAECWH